MRSTNPVVEQAYGLWPRNRSSFTRCHDNWLRPHLGLRFVKETRIPAPLSRAAVTEFSASVTSLCRHPTTVNGVRADRRASRCARAPADRGQGGGALPL